MSGTVLIEEPNENEKSSKEKEEFLEERDIDVKNNVFSTLKNTIAPTLGDEIQTDKLNSQNFENGDIGNLKMMLANGISECNKNPAVRRLVANLLINFQNLENGDVDHLKSLLVNGISECNNKNPAAAAADTKTSCPPDEPHPNRAEIGDECEDNANEFVLQIDASDDSNDNSDLVVKAEPISPSGETKSYRCHICDKLFSRNSSLQCHVRLHVEGPENILRSSVDEEPTDDQGAYDCVFCDRTFGRKSDLKSHVQFHLKAFQDEAATEIDKPASVAGDELSCVLCDKTFATKDSLIEHYKSHSHEEIDNEPVVEVRRRPRGRPPRSSYAIAVATSTPLDESNENEDGKQYKCYICDKQFARNSSLMWHIQFHETYTYSKMKKANESQCAEIGVKQNDDGPGPVRRCHICGKSFETNGRFRRHMSFHGVPDPADEAGVTEYVMEHQCDLCEKGFMTVSGLKRHVSISHRSQTGGEPIDEVVMDEGEREHKCSLCERSFMGVSGLKRHVSVTHRAHIDGEPTDEVVIDEAEKDHKCNLCERSFMGVSGLKRHVSVTHRAHLEEEPMAEPIDEVMLDESESEHKCDLCGKCFAAASGLKRHITLMHRPQISLEDDELLAEPINDVALEENETEHKCELCGKHFPTFVGLKRHTTLMHRPQIPPVDEEPMDDVEVFDESEMEHKCDLCGKSFATLAGLKRHATFMHRTQVSPGDEDPLAEPTNDVVLDENETEHKCELCEKHFSTDIGLKRHATCMHRTQITPGDEDPLAEPMDDVVFDESEMEHKCDFCEKSFATLAGVKRHATFMHRTQISPSEVEPTDDDGVLDESLEFKCELCDRSFNQAGSLRKHMRVHDVASEERKANSCKCQKCGKLFSTASNMKTHSLFHCKGLRNAEEEADENDGEYPCDHCDRIFCSLRAMRIHSSCRHKLFIDDASGAEENSHDDDSLVEAGEKRDHEEEECVEEKHDKYKCEECGKMFDSLRNMKIHYALAHHSKWDDNYFEDLATNEPPASDFGHECPVCHKKFESQRGMRIHASMHKLNAPPEGIAAPAKKEDPFEFDADAETFAEYRGYRTHATGEEKCNNNDDDSVAELKCSHCDRMFSKQQSLAAHMKVHSRILALGGDDDEENRNDGDDNNNDDDDDNNNDDADDKPTAEEGSVTADPDAPEKTYPCRKCDKVFSRMGLVGHMRFHKNRRDDPPTSAERRDSTCKARPPTLDSVSSPTKARPYSPLEHASPPAKTRSPPTLDRTSSPAKARRLPAPTPQIISRHPSEPPLTTFKQVGTIDDLMYCDVCNMTFIRKQDMSKHVRMHLFGLTKEEVDMDVYKCKFCWRSFAGRKSLNTHVAYHHRHVAKKEAAAPVDEDDAIRGVKRATTDVSTRSSKRVCSKPSTTTTTTQNSTSKPETEQPPFECAYCEFSFTEKERLLEHVRLHEEGAAVTNAVVGEHFVIQDPAGKEEYFIFEHHEQSQGYQCNECDESYQDKLQMIIHMSYHMGKRRPEGLATPVIVKADAAILAPHKCGLCDERFVNKDFLRDHERKRHGDSLVREDAGGEEQSRAPAADDSKLPNGEPGAEERQRCEYCGKYFTSKWFLKRHMRKQCAEKLNAEKDAQIFSYRCEFCELKFDDKGNLTEHMQTHVLTYNCDNCPFQCENVTELYTHACILTTE